MPEKKEWKEWDVIVVGGGPGGLTAAYLAARKGFKTILFERQRERGRLSHPDGGVISSIPSLVTLSNTDEGLKIKELDLLIPNSLIEGQLLKFGRIGPSGTFAGVNFKPENAFWLIRKDALLNLLANQAEDKGAILRFGVKVEGVLKKDNIVIGVVADGEEYYSKVVISAEGDGKICQKAGLKNNREILAYVYVVFYKISPIKTDISEMIVVVGLEKSIGVRNSLAFYLLSPNRQEIGFAVLTKEKKWRLDKPITFYLDELLRKDTRFERFKDCKVIHKDGCVAVARVGDTKAVIDGFIGLGDAVVHGGEASTLGAMGLAKQAVDIASSRILGEKTYRKNIKEYENSLKYIGRISEKPKLFHAVMNFSDKDWDTGLEIIKSINMEPFFSGNTLGILYQLIKFYMLRLPDIIRHKKIIKYLL